MSNSKSKSFSVFMYEDEKRYLDWLVLQRQNIETGGDLFGLWRSEDTAIVQLIIGPGKRCFRTETSFFQDINYLSTVGNKLISSHGLCNIGEWHSHHRIDLASPSQGDQNTVWEHMNSVSGGRFLLFIASITGPNLNPKVNIGCFMFSTKTEAMSTGSLQLLRGGSPIRRQFDDVSLKPGPEQGVDWVTFPKEGGKRSREPPGDSQKKTDRINKSSQKEPAQNTTEHHREKTNGKEFSKSPRKTNNKNVTHAKEHRHDEAVTKNNSDKTRLITAPYSTYGSTQTKQNESESKVNKPPTKKAPKSQSRFIADGVIKTQPSRHPLRDVTTPTSEMTENETKNASIFDCCNVCQTTSNTQQYPKTNTVI